MLAETLNKYEVSFVTAKEGVSLEASPQDDAFFDEGGVVVDEGLSAFLDKLDELTVWIDDHPLDRRAGLVCFVESNGETAWYDENSECCWV